VAFPTDQENSLKVSKTKKTLTQIAMSFATIENRANVFFVS
jgi:hypothetical protein